MQTHNKSNGYVAVAMMAFMTVCGAVGEEPTASQIVEGNEK
jgi:hypothetical protein